MTQMPELPENLRITIKKSILDRYLTIRLEKRTQWDEKVGFFRRRTVTHTEWRLAHMGEVDTMKEDWKEQIPKIARDLYARHQEKQSRMKEVESVVGTYPPKTL